MAISMGRMGTMILPYLADLKQTGQQKGASDESKKEKTSGLVQPGLSDTW